MNNLKKGICPSCSTIFLKGEKFCVFDGTALVLSDQIDVANLVFCPECSATFKGKKFCPFDGIPLRKLTADVTDEDLQRMIEEDQLAMADDRDDEQPDDYYHHQQQQQEPRRSLSPVREVSPLAVPMPRPIIPISPPPNYRDVEQSSDRSALVPRLVVPVSRSPSPPPPPPKAQPEPPKVAPPEEKTSKISAATAMKMVSTMMLKGKTKAAIMASYAALQEKFKDKGVSVELVKVGKSQDGNFAAKVQLGMAPDELTVRFDAACRLEAVCRRWKPRTVFHRMRMIFGSRVKGAEKLQAFARRRIRQRQFKQIIGQVRTLKAAMVATVLQAHVRRLLAMSRRKAKYQWQAWLNSVRVLSKYLKMAVVRRRRESCGITLSRHARAAVNRKSYVRLIDLMKKSRKPGVNSLMYKPLIITAFTNPKPPINELEEEAKKGIKISRGLFQSEEHVMQYLNAITFGTSPTGSMSNKVPSMNNRSNGNINNISFHEPAKTPTALWPNSLRSSQPTATAPTAIPAPTAARTTAIGGEWDNIGSMSKPSVSAIRLQQHRNAKKMSDLDPDELPSDSRTLFFESNANETSLVNSSGAFAQQPLVKKTTPRKQL